MDTKEIGSELRGWRSKKNYSREDVVLLAKQNEVKISKETLRRYENDASIIPLDKLLFLLSLYGTTLEFFITQICAKKHEIVRNVENNQCFN